MPVSAAISSSLSTITGSAGLRLRRFLPGKLPPVCSRSATGMRSSSSSSSSAAAAAAAAASARSLPSALALKLEGVDGESWLLLLLLLQLSLVALLLPLPFLPSQLLLLLASPSMLLLLLQPSMRNSLPLVEVQVHLLGLPALSALLLCISSSQHGPSVLVPVSHGILQFDTPADLLTTLVLSASLAAMA